MGGDLGEDARSRIRSYRGRLFVTSLLRRAFLELEKSSVIMIGPPTTSRNAYVGRGTGRLNVINPDAPSSYDLGVAKRWRGNWQVSSSQSNS